MKSAFQSKTPLAPLILSVDTSTQVCSVAVHSNGSLVATLETYTENSHAENLTHLMDQVCKLSKVTLQDIAAFALTKGPGSYTGLRIAAASLKGLCFALDKPLIGVSTLRVLAEAILPALKEDEWACPMIDARRMEVYCGLFDSLAQPKMDEQPKIIDSSSFMDLLPHQRIVFIGNGAPKCREVIQSTNARFVANLHPLAKNMGTLALQAFLQQQFEDIAYFEPEYLKEFYTTAKIVA